MTKKTPHAHFSTTPPHHEAQAGVLSGDTMFFKSSILHFLLAALIAVSPSVCLCGPKAAESVSSCCKSGSVVVVSDCCATLGDQSTKRVTHCDAGDDAGQSGPDGCDRCEGSCKCKTAPTMKAEAPTTMHVAALVVVAMVYGIELAPVDFDTMIRAVRIESHAVPRPVTTLLRQHCALTI